MEILFDNADIVRHLFQWRKLNYDVATSSRRRFNFNLMSLFIEKKKRMSTYVALEGDGVAGRRMSVAVAKLTLAFKQGLIHPSHKSFFYRQHSSNS